VAFVLTYEGPLPGRSSESGLRIKNALRRVFDPQIREFCQHDIYFSAWLRLRTPHAMAEVHGFSGTSFTTTGCLCLLADDSLISAFHIQTHRLLRPMRPEEQKTDVEARIRVEIRQERRTL